VLKRILAVLATTTLAIGLALGGAMSASAHTGDLPVTAVCNIATGTYDVTAKLNITQAGTKTGVTSWRVGTSTFQGTPTSANGMTNTINVTGDGTYLLTTFSLPGTTTGYGPWVYAHTTFSDGFKLGSDGQLKTALAGNCGAEKACINPLSNTLKNFSIVTSGDVTLNSTSHVTGTIAAAGNVTVGTAGYSVGNNEDGSALPNVDGKSTGLLTGGKVVLNASDAALKVLNGATRVGDTAGATIKEGNRYLPISANSPFVQMSANATLGDVTATGLWNTTFTGAFASLTADSTKIANLTDSQVLLVTAVANGQDGKKVKLTEGVTNVLRLSSSDLAGITKLFFDTTGAQPSATTPFIIDVTGSGSPATVPVINAASSDSYHYILWNFSKITGTLTLKTSTGNDFVRGSVLAPSAAVVLSSGGIEGQIAAKSFTHASGSEFHHYGFLSCATVQSVSGAATAAAATCDTTTYSIANGSVTATIKNGVKYELWNQAQTTKIADLTAGTAYPIAAGTYFVKVLPTSSAYSVSSGNTWIQAVVAAYTGECKAPQDVAGAATTKAQTCDVDYDLQNGSVTPTVKTGVTYQLWSADKGTKIADLTAGTAYPIANGTYYVKVLPASSSYTVSAPNTWIEAVVGAYQGTCAESVSGAVTTKAQICDVNYDLQNGSVTATVKTGVVYELWNQAKTQKIADLTAGTAYPVTNGTYNVLVKASSAKYTVSADNQWIEAVVGAYTGVCAQDVSGAATAGAETCDVNYDIKLGTVTATAMNGVTYQLWSADKGTKIADLTAGTAYPIGNGSYYVKVVPATSKFNVTSANEWIQVVVGKYTGVCAQDTSGSVTPAAETCQTSDWTIQDGAVTANTATGVKYELYAADKTTKISNLTIGQAYPLAHGSYWVKVVPATSKYVVSSANEWIPVTIGEFTGVCAEDVSGSATPSPEVCDTKDYSIAQGSILADVKDGVRYELWNATKTTKIDDLVAGTAYPVANGTYYVRVIATTTKYDVASANEWIEQIVGKFTGVCAEDVSGSAKTAGEVCEVNPYKVAQGSVTANAATGVVYELWNQAKTTKIADLTAGTAYPVNGGTYFVKVLPATDKYQVSGANEWIQVDVATNKVVCEVIGDPTKFEACVVNPNDFNDSNWTASLTIVAVSHVQYRVYISDGVTWVDKGIWAAGTYGAGTPTLPLGSLVKVVAEPESGWSLLAPKDWTFQFAKGFDCDLSTNGVVDPVVTFAQTCEAGATYTLAIDGGVAGSVLWSVNNGPTTTQLGTFSVAPGSTVKIVATPGAGAGFTGAGQTALERTYEKTFTSGAECDLETLAFTGQNVTPYLVIAVILFQAGLALVAVQFIRARRRARHLAAD
jgi:choice-of-anchor A domain-containing protein